MQKRAQCEVLPLAAKGLRLRRGERTVLDHIDVNLGPSGGLTVILGPNGAGKSLLVRALANLLACDGGQVTWAGRPPDRWRAPRIGFVFQKPVLLRRSVIENVIFALTVSRAGGGNDFETARLALADAGLDERADQPARTLSGGEQQRLALARAMACNPEILMLDEPTANLDPASMAAIEMRLKAIRAAGTPMLMITHDLAQAKRLADNVLFMHRGRILEAGPGLTFFEAATCAEARAFLRGEIVV